MPDYKTEYREYSTKMKFWQKCRNNFGAGLAGGIIAVTIAAMLTGPLGLGIMIAGGIATAAGLAGRSFSSSRIGKLEKTASYQVYEAFRNNNPDLLETQQQSPFHPLPQVERPAIIRRTANLNFSDQDDGKKTEIVLDNPKPVKTGLTYIIKK